MLRFENRPDDTDFSNDPDINAARAKVAQLFAAALPTFQDDKDRIAFPKKVNGKDSDFWGDYKDKFAAAQHGRCGYCELPAIGTHYGDVEHFRPKGEVRILNREKQGRERTDLSNVADRKSSRTIGTGYWWDAYSWDNYLLSCAICNQAWKKNFFPIDTGDAPRERPEQGVQESELLLHPFGDDDPADHFEYKFDGIIRGKTKMGVHTIETVGLWRPSLVVKRRKVIQSLLRLIVEMTAPDATNDLIRSHTLTILERGAEDWPIFPGLTRIVFTQVSGMTWDELQNMG